VTIPTAATSASEVDVEEGVDVLSTPQEPFLGMTFGSLDAARDYYNSYARHTGFSIRTNTSRESKRSGDKTKFIFVCQKAGVNKKDKVVVDGPITEKIVRERHRDYVDRTRCPACMIVRRTFQKQWEVVHFEKSTIMTTSRSFRSQNTLTLIETNRLRRKILSICCMAATLQPHEPIR
jgi:hypothetical protein